MNRRLFLITTGIMATAAGLRTGTAGSKVIEESTSLLPLNVLTPRPLEPTARPRSSAIVFVATDTESTGQSIV